MIMWHVTVWKPHIEIPKGQLNGDIFLMLSTVVKSNSDMAFGQNF